MAATAAAPAGASDRRPAVGAVAADPGAEPANDPQLDQAAPEQHEHQVAADRRRRGEPEHGVQEPAGALGGAVQARPGEAGGGTYGDGGHRRARAGTGTPHHHRWGRAEEHHRQHDDQDHRRKNEAKAADHRARRPRDAAGEKDRKLGGGGAGQQVAGRERILELALIDPLLAVHHETAQQCNVGRRAAEAGDADPRPVDGDGPQRNGPRGGLAHQSTDPWPGVLRDSSPATRASAVPSSRCRTQSSSRRAPILS